MVADTYGIGVLVADLMGVYAALKEGKELPPAPGRFEDVLIKDNEFRANEAAVEKDRAFFDDYFKVRHSQRPIYCGIHGNGSDRWLEASARVPSRSRTSSSSAIPKATVSSSPPR